MKLFYMGDSWSLKGYTKQNYESYQADADDIRLPDLWSVEYEYHSMGGKGNLACLDWLLEKNLPADLPIVWVYTEPGRDYARITGHSDINGWLLKEDYFEIRPELENFIFKEIKSKLPNPIALIGGLSDVNTELALEHGFHVLHPSWQKWTAKCIDYDLDLGWGAPDLLWRMKQDNIKRPAKSVTYKSINWLKFNKNAEITDYMFMYHPTPKSNKEFGEYLQADLHSWIEQIA